MSDQSATQHTELPKEVSLVNTCSPHCASLFAAALSKHSTEATISEQQSNEIKAQVEERLNEGKSCPNETVCARTASHVAIKGVESHTATEQCVCPNNTTPPAAETPERIDLSVAFSTLGIQTNVNFTNIGHRVNTFQSILNAGVQRLAGVNRIVQQFLEDQNVRNFLVATVDFLLILYAFSYLFIYFCNCYLANDNDNED